MIIKFTFATLLHFKTNIMKKVIVILSLSSLLFQCKNDETIPEENELITTINLNFISGQESKIYTWKDLDGDGGKAAVIDNIGLKPNTTYTLITSFLDETQSPIFDIGAEIKKEQDEHLIVYTSSPMNLFNYTYTDKDSKNLPVGFNGTVKTGATGSGKLKVQLRHQPPIGTKVSKDGTPGPGSDDINIDFNVELK